MSSYTIENVLFGLQSRPDLLERFQADPAEVLADYPLDADERRLLLNWDVRALEQRGVSGMLLMVGFTAVYGQQRMPEYMARMNTPAPAAAPV